MYLLRARYYAGPLPQGPQMEWWLGAIWSQASLGRGDLVKLPPKRFQKVLIFCRINGWDVEWKEWGRVDGKEREWKGQFESFRQWTWDPRALDCFQPIKTLTSLGTAWKWVWPPAQMMVHWGQQHRVGFPSPLPTSSVTLEKSFSRLGLSFLTCLKRIILVLTL